MLRVNITVLAFSSGARQSYHATRPSLIRQSPRESGPSSRLFLWIKKCSSQTMNGNTSLRAANITYFEDGERNCLSSTLTGTRTRREFTFARLAAIRCSIRTKYDSGTGWPSGNREGQRGEDQRGSELGSELTIDTPNASKSLSFRNQSRRNCGQSLTIYI